MAEVFGVILGGILEALAGLVTTNFWRVYLPVLGVIIFSLVGGVTFGSIPFFLLLGIALIFGIIWQRRSGI